jgi:hypothetical protein
MLLINRRWFWGLSVALAVLSVSNLEALAQGVAPARRPPGVLLYAGHGALKPPADYTKLQSFYETLGLLVDTATSWPDNLSSYRLIILLVPKETFSSDQVRALQRWLRRGQYLLVLGEYKEFIQDQTAINVLLADLGVGIRLKDNSNTDWDNDTCEPLRDIAEHPLTRGVREAGGLDPSRTATLEVFGTATALVRIQGGRCGGQPMRLVGEPVCAVGKPRPGRGQVVVCGDSNFLDDRFGLSDPASDGMQGNWRFACNLVQPFLPRRSCDRIPLPPSASAPASGATTRVAQLRVFDLNGRLMGALSNADGSLALDRFGLPNGVYLIVVVALDADGAPRRQWLHKAVVLR